MTVPLTAISRPTTSTSAITPSSRRLPPMAWTTWNAFRFEYNESVVMQQAHAMIDSGLHKLGYDTIQLDDGWMSRRRDCHFADPPSSPVLKHLLKGEGECSRMTAVSPTARLDELRPLRDALLRLPVHRAHAARQHHRLHPPRPAQVPAWNGSSRGGPPHARAEDGPIRRRGQR